MFRAQITRCWIWLMICTGFSTVAVSTYLIWWKLCSRCFVQTKFSRGGVYHFFKGEALIDEECRLCREGLGTIWSKLTEIFWHYVLKDIQHRNCLFASTSVFFSSQGVDLISFSRCLGVEDVAISLRRKQWESGLGKDMKQLTSLPRRTLGQLHHCAATVPVLFILTV